MATNKIELVNSDSSCFFSQSQNKYKLPEGEINFSFTYSSRLVFLSSILFLGLHSGVVYCQKLPDVTIAPKGQTINLSLQTGSKSNLSFGSNTSFGASLSSASSPGMTVTTTSFFVPTTGSITSTIGEAKIGDTSTFGKTTANISNLKAAGTGTSSIPGTPSNITDSTFASGNAELFGVTAKINIDLNGDESAFKVESTPNIVGGTVCKLQTGEGCKYSDADGKKPYPDQQFANGSANAQIGTNTTVDIGTSQFTSSFSQSF